MKYKILGWIFFLPIATLAIILLEKLLHYFNQFTLWSMGYSTSSPLGEIYDVVITGISTGYVFVFVGANIVPNYKNYVAWFLAIILNFILISEYWKTYESFDFSEFLFFILVFISSVVSVLRIINPDDKPKFTLI